MARVERGGENGVDIISVARGHRLLETLYLAAREEGAAIPGLVGQRSLASGPPPCPDAHQPPRPAASQPSFRGLTVQVIAELARIPVKYARIVPGDRLFLFWTPFGESEGSV